MSEPVHVGTGALRRSGALASLGLRELLTGAPRPVRLLGAYPRAMYLATDGGAVVAVLAPEAVRLPNGVVVDTDALRRVADCVLRHASAGGAVARVGDLAVTTHCVRLRVGRWWSPRLVVPAPVGREDAVGAGRRVVGGSCGAGGSDSTEDPLRMRGGSSVSPVPGAARPAGVVDRLEAAVAELPDPFTGDDRLAAGVAAFSAALADHADSRSDASLRRILAVADWVLGRGAGLTPAGDDVVAGALAALRTGWPGRACAAPGPQDWAAVADAVAQRARVRCGAVSAALIAHAARGEVAAPVAAVLTALTAADGVRLDEAVQRLATVGHTSGPATLRGLGSGLGAIVGAPDAVGGAATGGRTEEQRTRRSTGDARQQKVRQQEPRRPARRAA